MQHYPQVNQQTERLTFDLSGANEVMNATQTARAEGREALLNLSSENLEIGAEILTTLTGMTDSMASTANTVKNLGTRADLFPVDRDRMIKEAIERGEAGVAENGRKLETLLIFADADLYTQSMPPRATEHTGRMEARDEIKTALQLTDDPTQTLRRLATLDNEVAAEILSSYGESVVTALGIEGADIEHLRKTAETFALQSKNEGRRKAAEARRSLGKLRAVGKAYQNQVWSAYRAELSGQNRRNRIQAAEARTPSPRNMPKKPLAS